MAGPRLQVRIRLNAGRVDLSRVSIVPVDRANPIRESTWRGRKYLWPNRGDYDIIVKSGEHVVVCDHGTLIAVYGYVADSRKRGEVFAALVRAMEGAKAKGSRVEADNAELIAEVVGSDAIAEMTAQMASAGYAASKDPEKATANVAAWLIKHYIAAAAAPGAAEERKEEQRQEQKQQKEEKGKQQPSVVERIERLLNELAEQRPAEEQKPAEQHEEKPAQQAQQEQRPAQQQTAVVDMQRGIIELPDGTILVRFYLVKFQKTSEYAVQKVERNNGKDIIEEVRKIPEEVASLLSSLRRRVNEELASIAKLVTLESVFGKSAGMWLALDAGAVEQVKHLQQKAIDMLRADPRFKRLPKELQAKLLDGYRFYATQWWLPLDEAINLLKQLHTAVEAAKKEKERKLRQLKKTKAKRELQRLQALEQKLQELQKRLEELARLKP